MFIAVLQITNDRFPSIPAALAQSVIRVTRGKPAVSVLPRHFQMSAEAIASVSVPHLPCDYLRKSLGCAPRIALEEAN